ncbi:MAG: hypothetical protein IPK99_01850 [Flavobacteriales bacterium]|nr:hypothetical protein [Flavobacteriales bacterium]
MLMGIDTTFSVTTWLPGVRPDIGPEVIRQWSTGAFTDSVIISSSALVSLAVDFVNGCLSLYDEVDVTIIPYPEHPLLSDGTGMYFNSPGPHITPIPIAKVIPSFWCNNVSRRSHRVLDWN